MSGAIDWPAILSTCARIGIAPHRAWCLSLVEWRALTGSGVATALARPALDALIDRFPDTPGTTIPSTRTQTP